MLARPARPLAAASGLALAGLALAGGAPAAHAAPGDNGDVKIHKVGTPYDDRRNEPKVCQFYLAAFDFDTVRRVRWEIAPQPDRAGDADLGGSLRLAGGAGRTGQLALPDGTYRLTWAFDGAQRADGSRVFQVDCPGGGNGANGGGTNGSGTNSENGNGWSGGGENGSGGNGNGGNGQHRPPQGPVGAGGGGSAELAAAEDGSTFGVGAAVAAGLAGTVGLVLIRRSRRRDDGAA